MADGQVVFEVKLDSDGFSSALEGLLQGSALGAIGTKIGSEIAKAAVETFREIISTGIDFTSALSQFEAVSGATKSQLEAVEAAAKRLGETTVFTPAEAANAFVELAKAGWDTEESISAISSVLSMAAAENMSLSTAATIAADVVSMFGGSASDAASYIDAMAAASAASTTDITGMYSALKYVGPLAGTLGYSIGDVSTALGVMANNGIKATTAGTTLRSLLSRMADPTDEVAAAMKDLGVSLTDMHGNATSLSTVVETLRTGFQGLDSDTQLYYASTLAAKTGMNGLLTLVNASEGDFKAMSAAIKESAGTTEKMAKTMIDNLGGDLKLLESAFEGLKLAVFDGYEEKLRAATKVTTDFINALTTLANIWNGKEPLFEVPENFEIKPLNKSPWEILFGKPQGTEKSFWDYLFPKAGAEGVSEELSKANAAFAANLSADAQKALVEAFENGEITYDQLVEKMFSSGEGGEGESTLDATMMARGASAKAAFVAGFAGTGEGMMTGTEGASGGEEGSTDSLLALGLSLAQAVSEGIAQGSTDVNKQMRTVIEGAKTSVTSLLPQFNTLGHQISSGIAKGIKAGSGEIASALIAAIKGALAAAKKTAGIASPSRLFAAEVGHWIPAGVAVGVEDNLVTLRKAVNSMVYDTMPDMSRFGRNVSSSMGFMWQGNRLVQKAARQEFQVPQEINFNVPVQTPDEFAQTVQLFATYGLEADY